MKTKKISMNYHQLKKSVYLNLTTWKTASCLMLLKRIDRQNSLSTLRKNLFELTDHSCFPRLGINLSL